MDYNIEQSSSADIKNIKWTQKNPKDTEKSKKKNADKRHQNSSKQTRINDCIIYKKTKKAKSSVEKVFKVKEIVVTEKSKKKNADKRHQNFSASNCKIKQGFTRKGR